MQGKNATRRVHQERERPTIYSTQFLATYRYADYQEHTQFTSAEVMRPVAGSFPKVDVSPTNQERITMSSSNFRDIFGVDKGPTPNDKQILIDLMETMHSSSAGSFLDVIGVCCSGKPTSSTTKELELRRATLNDGTTILYVNGLRLRKWCIDEHSILPFELTEDNIRLMVQYMINHGLLTKARVAHRGAKILAPVEDGIPSAPSADFNKEFYLWNAPR